MMHSMTMRPAPSCAAKPEPQLPVTGQSHVRLNVDDSRGMEQAGRKACGSFR